MHVLVIAGLVPAIHVFLPRWPAKAWMAGSGPAMTSSWHSAVWQLNLEAPCRVVYDVTSKLRGTIKWEQGTQSFPMES